MFPGGGGVSPKNMQAMMKKMGIKTEEIDATEVVIKAKDKEIVISSPEVVKTIIQNNVLFQISGKIEERALKETKEASPKETKKAEGSGIEETDEEVSISDEDIKMVMLQTGKGAEDSKKALVEANGNIAEAIIKLTS